MGFLTKACSLCGVRVFSLGGNSLKDGCYCKQCKTKLSPFFTHQKTLTVSDIREQLEKRKANEQFIVQRAVCYVAKIVNGLIWDIILQAKTYKNAKYINKIFRRNQYDYLHNPRMEGLRQTELLLE